MEPIRIMLVGMPRMLSDIIGNVVKKQSDIVVVGELSSRTGLAAEVQRLEPDVVVIGLEGSRLPDECESVFDVDPHVRVLGVSGDGRELFACELRPQSEALGEVSPEKLMQTIRGRGPTRREPGSFER